jgi:hypothetical protein
MTLSAAIPETIPSSASRLASSSSTARTTGEEQQPHCSPCAKLLQEVLNTSTSRPRVLLQSIMGISNDDTNTAQKQEVLWRIIPNGVEVAIPTDETAARGEQQHLDSNRSSLRRRWTRWLETDMAETATPTTQLSHHGTTINSSRSNSLQRRPTLQLATSSLTTPPSATTQATTTASASSASSSSSPPATEWLSLSCRTCADTGPEANARAFCMGPTPLSVVVCTNRLLHLQKTTCDDDNNNNNHTAAASSAAALAEMEEILTHELVHVYDVRQLKLDLRDCENLAYSEVRAAREAECASLVRPKSWLAAAVGSSTVDHSQCQYHQATCVHQKAWTATHNLLGRGSLAW